MKRYIFIQNKRGNFTRDSDGVRGNLEELPEEVTHSSIISPLPSTKGFTPVIQPPAPVLEYIPNYKEQRASAYDAVGATTQNLIVALWKSQVEGDNTELNDIQTKRLQVKSLFPSISS